MSEEPDPPVMSIPHASPAASRSLTAMSIINVPNFSRVVLAAGLLLGSVAALPVQGEPTLDGNTFAELRKQIRPQPGESRWMEIPWLIDIHEARKKAAADGKPIFLYSGGGSSGIGAC